MINKLSYYVMLTADGDETAIKSSGLPTSKEPEPVPPLTKPEGLTLADGVNAGELEISINKLPGARTYQYEYTADPTVPESIWRLQASTIRKTLLTGLDSGKRYWCRVGVVGTNEQVVYSDPASRVVQ